MIGELNNIVGVTPQQAYNIALQVCSEQADFNLWWKAAIAFSGAFVFAELLHRWGLLKWLEKYYVKLPWIKARLLAEAAKDNKTNKDNKEGEKPTEAGNN